LLYRNYADARDETPIELTDLFPNAGGPRDENVARRAPRLLNANRRPRNRGRDVSNAHVITKGHSRKRVRAFYVFHSAVDVTVIVQRETGAISCRRSRGYSRFWPADIGVATIAETVLGTRRHNRQHTTIGHWLWAVYNP